MIDEHIVRKALNENHIFWAVRRLRPKDLSQSIREAVTGRCLYAIFLSKDSPTQTVLFLDRAGSPFNSQDESSIIRRFIPFVALIAFSEEPITTEQMLSYGQSYTEGLLEKDINNKSLVSLQLGFLQDFLVDFWAHNQYDICSERT